MRPIRIPKTKYPKKLESKLFHFYWEPFQAWLNELTKAALAQKEQLDLLRVDSDETDEQLDDRLDGLFDEVFAPFVMKWRAAAAARDTYFHKFGLLVNAHVRMGLQRQVDLAASVSPDLSKAVPGLTPEIHSEIEDFVSENVRLVRKIGEEAADRLQRLVIEAHKSGLSTRKLADQIELELKYNENRCELIAADQLGKANADLTRVNHQASNIIGYFWTTSKVKVRPLHQAREGQYFSYDDPPSDGHAGKPIRCRCTATPDIFGRGPASIKDKPKGSPANGAAPSVATP